MNLLHLSEVGSTNDYVKKNIEKLEHLTFVYSDRQTTGRGRLERKWVDFGDDNLFLTIVIKPENCDISNISNLTQYLSVTLAMLLEDEFALSPKIKWPNDVLINGKKVAGILAEGTTHGSTFIGLALGIGVNLNTSADKLAIIDKPATSIFNETGHHINKELFLEILYNKFCLLYDKYIENGFPLIKEDYIQRAMFIGKEITVNILGKLHTGVAEGITDEGSIILKEDDKYNTYFIGDIL